jgi:hypothetical protein
MNEIAGTATHLDDRLAETGITGDCELAEGNEGGESDFVGGSVEEAEEELRRLVSV